MRKFCREGMFQLRLNALDPSLFPRPYFCVANEIDVRVGLIRTKEREN